MSKLYEMPFRFSKLMQRNQELQPCSLGQSIAQNIFLIISARYQEHRFDPEFGCEIWDKDFELITNQLAWQDDVNSSLMRSIERYEPRLERIDMDTLITEEPYYNPNTKVKSVKKRITVHIRGVIKATGEDFSYSPQLFLSPISID